MDGLKPCPFCGSGSAFVQLREVGIKGTGGYNRWHEVKCHHCDAQVGTRGSVLLPRTDTVQQAVDLWNRRTPAPQRERSI